MPIDSRRAAIRLETSTGGSSTFALQGALSRKLAREGGGHEKRYRTVSLLRVGNTGSHVLRQDTHVVRIIGFESGEFPAE